MNNKRKLLVISILGVMFLGVATAQDNTPSYMSINIDGLEGQKVDYDQSEYDVAQVGYDWSQAPSDVETVDFRWTMISLDSNNNLDYAVSGDIYPNNNDGTVGFQRPGDGSTQSGTFNFNWIGVDQSTWEQEFDGKEVRVLIEAQETDGSGFNVGTYESDRYDIFTGDIPSITINQPTDGENFDYNIDNTNFFDFSFDTGTLGTSFYLEVEDSTGTVVQDDAIVSVGPNSQTSRQWNLDNTLTDEAGDYTARVYDNQVGVEETVSFTIDEPRDPDVSITNPNNGDIFTQGTSLTSDYTVNSYYYALNNIEFNVEDSTGNLLQSQDIASMASNSQETFSSTVDSSIMSTPGDYTLYVDLVDSQGNEHRSSEISFTVQEEAPDAPTINWNEPVDGNSYSIPVGSSSTSIDFSGDITVDGDDSNAQVDLILEQTDGSEFISQNVNLGDPVGSSETFSFSETLTNVPSGSYEARLEVTTDVHSETRTRNVDVISSTLGSISFQNINPNDGDVFGTGETISHTIDMVNDNVEPFGPVDSANFGVFNLNNFNPSTSENLPEGGYDSSASFSETGSITTSNVEGGLEVSDGGQYYYGLSNSGADSSTLFKVDSNGNQQWSTSVGGSKISAFSEEQGMIVISGGTSRSGGTQTHEIYDLNGNSVQTFSHPSSDLRATDADFSPDGSELAISYGSDYLGFGNTDNFVEIIDLSTMNSNTLTGITTSWADNNAGTVANGVEAVNHQGDSLYFQGLGSGSVGASAGTFAKWDLSASSPDWSIEATNFGAASSTYYGVSDIQLTPDRAFVSSASSSKGTMLVNLNTQSQIDFDSNSDVRDMAQDDTFLYWSSASSSNVRAYEKGSGISSMSDYAKTLSKNNAGGVASIGSEAYVGQTGGGVSSFSTPVQPPPIDSVGFVNGNAPEYGETQNVEIDLNTQVYDPSSDTIGVFANYTDFDGGQYEAYSRQDVTFTHQGDGVYTSDEPVSTDYIRPVGNEKEIDFTVFQNGQAQDLGVYLNYDAGYNGIYTETQAGSAGTTNSFSYSDSFSSQTELAMSSYFVGYPSQDNLELYSNTQTYDVSLGEPATTNLNSPNDGAVFDYSESVTFDFTVSTTDQAANNIELVVEDSTGSEVQRTSVASQTAGSQNTFQQDLDTTYTEQPGEYTWYVEVTNEDGTVSTSNSRTFNINEVNQPATTLVSPNDASTFQYGEAIEFEWTSETFEAGANINIVVENSTGDRVQDDAVASQAPTSSNTYTWLADKSIETSVGKYYWYVEYEYEGNTVTSSDRTFEVTSPDAPTVSISNPSDGQTFTKEFSQNQLSTLFEWSVTSQSEQGTTRLVLDGGQYNNEQVASSGFSDFRTETFSETVGLEAGNYTAEYIADTDNFNVNEQISFTVENEEVQSPEINVESPNDGEFILAENGTYSNVSFTYSVLGGEEDGDTSVVLNSSEGEVFSDTFASLATNPYEFSQNLSTGNYQATFSADTAQYSVDETVQFEIGELPENIAGYFDNEDGQTYGRAEQLDIGYNILAGEGYIEQLWVQRPGEDFNQSESLYQSGSTIDVVEYNNTVEVIPNSFYTEDGEYQIHLTASNASTPQSINDADAQLDSFTVNVEEQSSEFGGLFDEVISDLLDIPDILEPFIGQAGIIVIGLVITLGGLAFGYSIGGTFGSVLGFYGGLAVASLWGWIPMSILWLAVIGFAAYVMFRGG